MMLNGFQLAIEMQWFPVRTRHTHGVNNMSKKLKTHHQANNQQILDLIKKKGNNDFHYIIKKYEGFQ